MTTLPTIPSAPGARRVVSDPTIRRHPALILGQYRKHKGNEK
jgi:hypothetical protein